MEATKRILHTEDVRPCMSLINQGMMTFEDAMWFLFPEDAPFVTYEPRSWSLEPKKRSNQ
jgi:hypothetical protein